MSMKTWDRAPSSPAEEQLRKVQDLFLKNGFQGKPVIELPEFVAAMTAPDSTIWAPMIVEAAQALFKEIDVTNNGFISKAKYTHYVSARTRTLRLHVALQVQHAAQR
jgi:Ca2+-binding EF-hand superfamily protein